MSTAIPSSFSFEMLSRLPANSFVLTWKEIRPDQQPLGNNGTYSFADSNRIRFVLRGAPNEFALNTNMYLCGSARLNIVQGGTVVVTPETMKNFANSATASLNNPIYFFQGSRESFNAGALPYLDNQDPKRSRVINTLRYNLARRNKNFDQTSLNDLKSAFNSMTNKLEFATKRNSYDFYTTIEGLRLATIKDPDNFNINCFGDKHFQIPLGTYSNFVNSHSVLPLGLLSSYAVNGWQIELQTAQQSGVGFGPVYQCEAQLFGPDSGVDMQVGAYMNDVRIYVPIIRVLDPAVMEAVLSLYEKREMVNVGGVQFPLSLRINTIAYRFSNYPLQQNQNDFFFRISGTDRSVRALAWWIYRRDINDNGYPSLTIGTMVTRLQTSIGNEQVHDVVEDNNINTGNVANFISMNVKRSGCLFSPLPYYQEARKFDGQQDDDLLKYNNTLATQIIPTPPGTTYYQKRVLSYGVVSFENLDRREAEYSGSFQASGKDLTNVGAIEVRMRIEQGNDSLPNKPKTSYVSPADLNDPSKLPPLGSIGNSGALNDNPSGYEIIFAYAYDSVMEVSPSGVMDITNAVL